MSMDIGITKVVKWLPKHEEGFYLICQAAEDNFLHRDELKVYVEDWIANNPDEGLAAAQELQEWFDDLPWPDDDCALHIHIYA